MTRRRKQHRAASPLQKEGGQGRRIGPRVRLAAGLAALTVVVGAIAAAVQPYDPTAPGCKDRTPPDETAHVLYVEHLLDKGTLPVLTSGGGNYEAHQPPLYYLSVLPAMAAGRAMDVGRAKTPGALTAEVVAGRLWSVLILAGVTVACYLTACVAFPRSPALQIAAPLFALLLPGHLINLAAITNDSLAELFSCLVIWLSVGLLRTPPAGYGRLLALSLLTGAALLTKTSCLFLLPVVAAAVLLSRPAWAAEPPPWLHLLLTLGLACAVVGVALLCWAPWIAHNLAHYPGDPLATHRFVEVFAQDRPTPERLQAALHLSPLGYWRLVFEWTYLSFWGVFGQAKVFMSGWYYLLATLPALAACVGALRGLPRWWRAERPTRYVWSLLALSAILVSLQFAMFNRTFFQAQARYVFPAIAPLACAFAAGLHLVGQRFGRAKGARWVLAATGLVLAILLVAALVAVALRGPVGLPVWL